MYGYEDHDPQMSVLTRSSNDLRAVSYFWNKWKSCEFELGIVYSGRNEIENEGVLGVEFMWRF
jgi:hypothetical protein